MTDAILAEVVHPLEGQKEIAEGDVPEPFGAEALAQAEREMWAFYLEWSAIVRGTITDGNLLRVLGFKKRAGGRTQKSPKVVITAEAGRSGSAPASQLPAE